MDTKGNKMKEPNIAVEVFLSLVKWFVVALVVTNLITSLIWAGVHYGYFAKSFNGTSMEVMQDGTNNNQSVKNG